MDGSVDKLGKSREVLTGMHKEKRKGEIQVDDFGRKWVNTLH